MSCRAIRVSIVAWEQASMENTVPPKQTKLNPSLKTSQSGTSNFLMSPEQHREQAKKLRLQVNNPTAQKLAEQHDLLAGAIENRLKRQALSKRQQEQQASKQDQEKEPSLQEKVAQQQADYAKWSAVAALPSLSPEEAEFARNMARSSKAALALGEKALAYQVKNENMNPPLPKIYKIISPNEYEYDVELYPQEVESWVKEINSNSKNVPIVCVQDANGKIVWQKQINISEAAHKLAADQGERLAQAAINRNAAVIERPGTSPAQAKSPKAPDRGHRSELLASWNHRLQLCGRAVAKAWLVLAGLILLFGFYVSGIAASFLIGFVAARIIGGGVGV